jgi:hypothetical protein
VIQSHPQGATVFINGRAVGQTPYRLTDRKIVGASTRIRLEYPGYPPFETVIRRNEELDALALVGGIFLLVPFLWILEYKDSHFYSLAVPGPLVGQPVPGPMPGGAAANSPPPNSRPADPVAAPTADMGVIRRANDLNAEGRELVRAGEYVAAIDKFHAAVKLHPDPRFFFNMCVAYEQIGKVAEAISSCEQVGRYEPSDRLRQKTDDLLKNLRARRGLGPPRRSRRMPVSYRH